MLRDALKHFAPSLIEYLDLKPGEWREVERKLDERNAIFEAQLKKSGEPLAIKTTIYDLMAEAFLGNTTAAGFLSYIDSIASGLDRLLPEGLQLSARLQARNLFMDFSEKTSPPKYLEKVGELAAILYILEKSGAYPLRFEAKIPDRNTSLDVLVELQSGHPVAVEILNVWINDRKLSDETALHAFLDGRIKKNTREN